MLRCALSFHDRRRREWAWSSTSTLADCRANNLRPKRKQLSVVFATVDGTKQGVCRAEQAQARADDYATAAEGREVSQYGYELKQSTFQGRFCDFSVADDFINLVFAADNIRIAFAAFGVVN